MITDRRRAFTLVELLVVIAIIALLISILLPSLNRAREAARTVACLSNTRQISMAVFQYAQFNRGNLPYHVNTTVTGPFTFSMYTGMNALYDARMISGGGMQTLRSADGFALSSRVVPILVCPGENLTVMTAASDWRVGAEFKNATSRNGKTGLFHAQYPYEYKYTSSGIATHYMFNGTHPNYIDPSFPGAFSSTTYFGTPLPQTRLSRIPSRCWILSDGTAGDFGGMFPAVRHPNVSANFAYADGHSETLRTSQVDAVVSFGGFLSVYPADSRSYINH